MKTSGSRRRALRLCAASWLAAATPALAAQVSDTTADYAYALPLTVAKPGMVQLRLPLDAYLHARTPALDDVRVFDAQGRALPYALRMPAVERSASHRPLPLKIFPLKNQSLAAQLDVDVQTDNDGRLTSVHLRPGPQQAGDNGPATGGNKAPQLAALILDLGLADAAEPPQIDGLSFVPPAGQSDYSAEVWLDTSDDMKHWDPAGGTELNWLVNQDAQTLANDKLDFSPRHFRYARLTWRRGTPQQFAAISARQLLTNTVPPYTETLLLPAAPGRQAGDLVYNTPLAVAAQKIGLRFKDSNVVLPALLGIYRDLPARQLGQAPGWRFDPLAGAIFYRIAQGDTQRASGDIEVVPTHTTQWVLRPQSPAAAAIQPMLRLNWTPASIVFLADGNAPYTLAVGRPNALSAARDTALVAPGFSEAELQQLASATAGSARLVHDNTAAATSDVAQTGAAAQRRLLALWGTLLLGVAVLAYMVWRLLKQARPPEA